MTATEAGFEMRTVAHLLRPWGRRARDLDELREGIASAPDEVLFHHTVQYGLRDPGAEALGPDDISAWVSGVVQDAETAERISFAVQTQNASAGAVRPAIVAALDTVPAKRRAERAVPEGAEFVFLSGVSLVYPTGVTVQDAVQAMEVLLGSDPGVWFLHLVEEPWYQGGASLLDWLKAGGADRAVALLQEAAATGLPIEKTRAKLTRRWRQRQIARRLAEATTMPEDERRDAARDAIARLVRRRTRTGPGT